MFISVFLFIYFWNDIIIAIIKNIHQVVSHNTINDFYFNKILIIQHKYIHQIFAISFHIMYIMYTITD